MAVSYKPLFKLMIDRKITKGELSEMSGVAYSTIRKMFIGENVNMSIVDRICTSLDCRIEEIVEIVPDDKEP
ncbi:MAG: helix-turn-helix transcriptional regulator [Lachnospiraceae bacterium]|nr:helix-turn-helix transcriptional regulator [Lachnospiraceae bacterium]